MNDAPVDLATFHALRDSAGADFVVELVAVFLEEAPKMLGTLSTSLTARDEGAFRRAAHSLKSNSMTFGANALAAMARDLELGAHDIVQRGDAGALDLVIREARRVAQALQELQDG